MKFADHLTSIADILLSTQTDGEVRCNIGELTDGAGWGAATPIWGQDGFLAMPNAADDDGACQALYVVDGNQKRIFATRDNRFTSKVPSLKAGDRAIVSNCDARIMLAREKNQIVLYSVNAKDDDSSMMVEVNGSEGSMTLLNGPSMVRLTKDKIQLAAGGTVVELSADGFMVFGKHCALNTGGGNLGVLGAIPPPQGVGSILAGPAGMTGVPSTKWTVGT